MADDPATRELLMALRHFVAQHKQELSALHNPMAEARQSWKGGLAEVRCRNGPAVRRLVSHVPGQG